MPASEHGPSVKDPEQYEALRDDGMSKEKAARISNTSASQGRSKVGRRGGKGADYEERAKKDLYKKAADVGIEGRSKMDKKELIDALRNH
ncbi:Rho termination factor N-terminal domain-containing protein [soil metagenome]